MIFFPRLRYANKIIALADHDWPPSVKNEMAVMIIAQSKLIQQVCRANGVSVPCKQDATILAAHQLVDNKSAASSLMMRGGLSDTEATGVLFRVAFAALTYGLQSGRHELVAAIGRAEK